MKVSWFSVGRIAVYLRRIALAQERIADAAESQAATLQRFWEAEHPARPEGARRKVDVHTFDQAEANRRWRQSQVESGDEA